MRLDKGDIVIVNFPFSDFAEGKPRPAIVISNGEVNKTYDVILAQITSNIRADEFSFYLAENILTKSLGTPCEVRCKNIFTAEKSIIRKKISRLKDENYSELYDQINRLLV